MSARVLTIAQQKGGAGKTTIVAHLAAAWAGQGRRIALIDMDPQESLSAWYWLRREMLGDDDAIALESATPARVPGLIERLKPACDLILIDSPPHTRTAAQVGITQADLLLVPLQLSPMDLWATRPTLEMAQQERTPAFIVLNRVPARSRAAEMVHQAITEKRLPLARTTLGNRSAFAASLMMGKGVTESEPSSMAAQEITALAGEVWRRIRRLD